MAFAFLDLKRLEREVDPKTGELTRLRLVTVELAPRTININLLKVDPARVERIERLIAKGDPVMMPLKEGIGSTGVYFQLEEGQILSIDREEALLELERSRKDEEHRANTPIKTAEQKPPTPAHVVKISEQQQPPVVKTSV